MRPPGLALAGLGRGGGVSLGALVSRGGILLFGSFLGAEARPLSKDLVGAVPGAAVAAALLTEDRGLAPGLGAGGAAVLVAELVGEAPGR